MDIKQRIKSAWKHLMGKANDSELGADEVVKKEVFPKPAKAKAKTTAKKSTTKTDGASKPLSKRTRPTNPDYRMINPDGGVDAGKS
ncbi:MAG: hypothetical protein K2F90_02285 [Clostridiales bacterium]|nr:hypothetical protein [Clostridiales bacterium]